MSLNLNMKIDVGFDALYDVFAAAVQHAMPLVIQGGGACASAALREVAGVPRDVDWSPLSRRLRVSGESGAWGLDVSDIDRVWLVGRSSRTGLRLALELFDAAGHLLASVSAGAQPWGRNCGWRLLLEQHTGVGLH